MNVQHERLVTRPLMPAVNNGTRGQVSLSFWEPTALSRFEAMGLPGPLGYIASRAAPLGPAGSDAVVAAFGSISPRGIALALDLVSQHTTFDALWAARDEAVLEGLSQHAPEMAPRLAEVAPRLWPVVDQLPKLGRVFYAAHLRMPRPADPVLSGWHVVNCIREWRGDTHWAVVAAAGLSGPASSILHNAWVNYEKDWLPASRGSTAEETAAGWAELEAASLAESGEVNPTGLKLRQHIENETDRLTALPWKLLGEEASLKFANDFEAPCEKLLKRVDITAGPNYQPASRLR